MRTTTTTPSYSSDGSTTARLVADTDAHPTDQQPTLPHAHEHAH